MATAQLLDSVAEATAHRDRDDIDIAVVRLLFDFLDAHRVAIYRVVDDDGVPRAQRRVALGPGSAMQGPEGHDPARLPSIADRADWRECLLLQDAVHSLDDENFSTRSVHPLSNETRVFGLVEIELGAPLKPRAAGMIDSLLRIVRNHLALLDYGERDTLTGLLNRKTFEGSFGKLLAQARAAGGDGEASWLGVIDIDHFKRVNDNYGHLFGDEVLLLVSQLMKRCFRGADALFRFGGEEFVVVLERASEEGAAIAFERLRAAIEQHRFPQIAQVTASLGYTRIDGSDSPAAAVERADEALYFAKRNGRNQVRHYETLVAAGNVAPKDVRAEVELF